ncbi:cyclic di-GMP binding protein [Spirochaetia bacterium]|nr:cyclic di-GMP binding protein [Spirochaetia bacterium]
MGTLTSQKIAAFYERYKESDVTYNKEIIQVTGLQTNEVQLKCASDFWPCVIYSSSFQGAKVVANVKSALVEKLRRANNAVSLRFCFKEPGQANPLTFFVSARSVEHTSYGGSQDVDLFTLQFTKRPPDDLIEIMGRLLDANANANSAKRRSEQIPINVDTLRKMNIFSNESVVFIQGTPRRCILRDIAFSEAKLVMAGEVASLEGKEAALRMNFKDPPESFLIKGKFTRVEDVESRKDLLALVLVFDEALVPLGYKLRLNDYLSTVRADNRSGDPDTGSANAAAPSEAAPPSPEGKKA